MNQAAKSQVAELQIGAYLRTLRECLPNLSVAEREEILREISVHIRESAEEPGANVGDILARLGSPQALASQYGHDPVIQRASRSLSPLTILHATLHLARRGVEGFFLFLVAFVGYCMGAAFIITALLKSFFPRETGLWVGPHTFDFGFNTPASSNPLNHEVLGFWYVPIALALGGFSLWITTYGIRWFLQRRSLRRVATASEVVTRTAATGVVAGI